MFVDELIDSFIKFAGQKVSFDKYALRQEAAIAKMNQQIMIRDLVVRTPSRYCFGESMTHTNPYQNISEKERLKDHIQLMFSLANEDHRANYCTKKEDGTFQLKQDKQNHLTCLTMNEFSLYTKKPLEENEFSELLMQLEQMATSLEPNVQILLSSFAVKGEHGKVINMSVFIEGGASPKLHSFAKNTASMVDIDYMHTTELFSQQRRGQQVTHHAEFISNSKGAPITTGSVFEVTTAGGAVCTKAIDVCLDHAFGHSKALMERRIMEDASSDEIIPEQIEQCVTSNWIDVYESQSIATTVLHADPVRSMHDFHHSPLGARPIKPEVIEQMKMGKYSKQLVISENRTGYNIANPAFGSDCIVEVLAERPAAQHLPHMQAAIKKHNKKALSQLQRNQFVANEADQTLHAAGHSNLIINRVEELEKKLLAKCRPTFWQKLFKTEEYRQKIAAKEVIYNSFKAIKPNFQSKDMGNVFLIKPWAKDLEFRLRHVSSLDKGSPFIKDLTAEIKTVIHTKLQEDLKVEFSEQETAENTERPSFTR